MPVEQFVNNAATTLSGNGGSITSGATSFNVADGSTFPSNGSFRVLINSELMIIGARSSNAFSSVTRAAEGTTAASHTDGDAVTQILTAASVKSLTNPGRAMQTSVPTSSWTWINQGSSSIATGEDSLVLTGAAVGNTANLVAYVRTAPATPYTVIARLIACYPQKQSLGHGLCFRESGTSELVAHYCVAADSGTTTMDLLSAKWTSPTSFSANYSGSLKYPGLLEWFKIQDDGTNRKFSISADGLSWIEIHSIGRTDFLTADQIGFCINNQNAATTNYGPIVRVVSWEVS